ncbi:glycerophosphoryl diester phosphodiesterase [Nakamurella panacisegetis]|uniref:Glycerophosphoryl diester phosphodiesterase n=1 Tax=Nakamurella panacisegetis TaxID=1090615 RepID=A0A1H0RV47_9ACTN|nr:glycerophosphodiester phosphodiesterase [Nakamurella panacisegetis]SDP32858.1 glycerophosphoryl diester phosphodiesterase [Nakamurella panacisegetis]
MTAYLDGSGPRAFAHRGWHIGDLAGCENSMAAFRRAVDEGYGYLETDVHATADGVLVAFHDSHLDRVTDRRGRIADLRWDQVRQARIGGREPIPLMADVLAAFPTTRFNIDPKSDRAVGPLIDLLRASGALDRVGLGSFSDRRLTTLRQALGPGVATSLGPRGVGRLAASARLHITPRTPGALAAQVPVRYGPVGVVNPAFVAAAHRSGIEVHVWTINEADEMRRLLDLGVDGIMTDRPDVLRSVLNERGQWNPA